jgi:hypothetical protein
VTAVEVYGYDAGTGPTGGTFQETLVVSGSTSQAITVNDGDCKRSNATLSFGSTTLTSTDTCGPSVDGGGQTLSYGGVTSTGFWVSTPVSSSITIVLTLTKQ